MSATVQVDISVIIPCHNEGAYLRESVDSVKREIQVTDLTGEIIVVNDRSTDMETLDILRELQADPRVRVIGNQGRPGPGSTRNTGIRAANGSWVAFLDGDDLWLPGGLAARWRVVQGEPEATWVGTDYRLLSPDGCVSESVFWERPQPRYLLDSGEKRGSCIRLCNASLYFLKIPLAHTSTVLVKRNILNTVGGFNERLRVGEDLHLWFRLANSADYYFIPQVTALYRQRNGSLTVWGDKERELMDHHIHVCVCKDLIKNYAIGIFAKQLRAKLMRLYIEEVYQYRLKRQFILGSIAACRAIVSYPRSSAPWRNLAACLIRRD